MGELKEKPVVQRAKRVTVAGRPVKKAAEAAKTRSFGDLTPEQEALYGAISSNTKNNLDAAATRAAKYRK